MSLCKDSVENLVRNLICKFCNKSDDFKIVIQELTKYRVYGLRFNELNELEREVETDETYQLIKITCGKCGNIIRENIERF